MGLIRLAVIEDNADNRLLLRALLDDIFAIAEYGTGEAALPGLRQSLPDAVLLDISLPKMDGVDVLRAIRADETLAALPVIAFTAHAMAGDRERFLAEGFDGYVAKPVVDEKVIIDLVRQLVEAV